MIVNMHVGTDLNAGERPQAFVPAGAWQSARSLGALDTGGLYGCAGISFDRFELAPPGWEPGKQG